MNKEGVKLLKLTSDVVCYTDVGRDETIIITEKYSIQSEILKSYGFFLFFFGCPEAINPTRAQIHSLRGAVGKVGVAGPAGA